MDFMGALAFSLLGVCLGGFGFLSFLDWRIYVHLSKQERGEESPQGWPLKPEDWLL